MERVAELEKAFVRWQAAVSEHDKARLALSRAIRVASRRGIPQADIARVLGWPRQRVHEALKENV